MSPSLLKSQSLSKATPFLQGQGESGPERSVFVSPEEFRALAISHRSLVRFDGAPPGVRGLLDLETKVRYLVEEAHLRQSLSN